MRDRIVIGIAVLALVVSGVGVGLVIGGLGGSAPEAAPMPERTFTTTVEVAPAPDTNLGDGPEVPDAFTAQPDTPPGETPVEDPAAPAGLGPNRVAIPSLEIDAPIVPVAVASARLDPPDDPQTVGWNAGGGRLDGADGTLLLTSHVNYVGRGLGAFYRLAQLAPNADVWTTDGEGRVSHWVITELASTPKTQVVDQTIFSPSGPRRLVLVTCGGEVRDGNYDHLVVAYGTLVDG